MLAAELARGYAESLCITAFAFVATVHAVFLIGFLILAQYELRQHRKAINRLQNEIKRVEQARGASSLTDLCI